jgi:hypothetical protein
MTKHQKRVRIKQIRTRMRVLKLLNTLIIRDTEKEYHDKEANMWSKHWMPDRIAIRKLPKSTIVYILNIKFFREEVSESLRTAIEEEYAERMLLK